MGLQPSPHDVPGIHPQAGKPAEGTNVPVCRDRGGCRDGSAGPWAGEEQGRQQCPGASRAAWVSKSSRCATIIRFLCLPQEEEEEKEEEGHWPTTSSS